MDSVMIDNNFIIYFTDFTYANKNSANNNKIICL